MNEQTADFGRLGTIVGAVAAPTGLITALLYYFGYYHAYWFFAYFGVNSTLLGFGTPDYLMRSLDALWVPMTVTAAAGLLAFLGHDLLRGRIAAGAWSRALRFAIPAVAGLGFLLALGGFWSTLTQTFLNRTLALAPLSLSIGVTLLAYALHLRRTVAASATATAIATSATATETAASAAADDAPAAGTQPPETATSGPDETSTRGPGDDAPAGGAGPSSAFVSLPEWAALAEWAVIFVLVGLGLVWAANDYAASVGETRARLFAAEMAGHPSAVLYSERSLSLGATGVRETRCDEPKAAYGYRYDGLTLILQSGNQYVLLPSGWSPTDGVALVIPRSASVRLEFGPPPRAHTTVRRPPAC